MLSSKFPRLAGFLAKSAALALAIAAVYLFRDQLYRLSSPAFNRIETALNLTKPCSKPLSYSIGAIDPRFNLSRKTLEDDASTAAKVWNDAAHKDLLQYSETGQVEIDLVYDDRQQTTDSISALSAEIRSKKADYNADKARYNALKAKLEQDKSDFKEKYAAYNAEVESYNAGKPGNFAGSNEKMAYSDLQAARQQLISEQSAINEEVSAVNAEAKELNDEASKLNALIAKYNSIGQAANGEQFDQGEYLQSGDSRKIVIFQFDSKEKLIRVLTHELGHALGLGHVDDPDAIMFSLNEGTNQSLTSADLTELGRACRLLYN